MCGIFGYIGGKPALPIVLEGLQRLEYRGYDSSGIALVDGEGPIAVHKALGKLQALRDSLQGYHPNGSTGIGHTRWATHGSPSLVNSHPHLDCTGEVAVVHNGIVENYSRLKEELQKRGHHFTSETDTEALAHLMEEGLRQGLPLEQAAMRAAQFAEGSHALVALCRREPGKMVAFRLGSAGGLVVGYGQGEMFLASDLPALLPHTRRVALLGSGELVLLTREGATYYDIQGQPLTREPRQVSYDAVTAAKGGYRHFMLKEIMEQPVAVLHTLDGRISFDPPGVLLEGIPFTPEEVCRFQRVYLIGCGTSYHAALVGRYWLESLAGIPTEAECASEFRYRNPLLDGTTLVVTIGQSGETADTLAAMVEARRRGAPLLTLCNVEGSQATHLADGVVYLRAGPEVAVASTKTFVSSLAALLLLSLHLGQKRGFLEPQRLTSSVEALAHLPALLGGVLERQATYEALAQDFFRPSHFLYLGRGPYYPIALEGALKLKEISYIHAEGYPAGEMKHGPIALIDENMPVVAIAPRDQVYSKMINNIEEVKARGGRVIALVSEGDREVASQADYTLALPQGSSLLTPILAVAPLQLLAYYIAVRRGCDVDQPRNLAKSVTVE